jgi:lambda repressor-like predicted transcriptional regulator
MVAVVRTLVGREYAVATAYRDGASTTALAARFDVSVSTICRVLERAGVDRRPRGPRVTGVPGREAEVAAAYRAGATIQEIADRNGCSTTPNNDALARAGITRRRPGRRRRQLDGAEPTIAAAYAAGATLAELGHEHGVSAKVIADVLEQQGVSRRQPGRRRRQSTVRSGQA